MKRKATISQCMIVKNEEKNIKKALSWGKSIVVEQIVVDTGSTDRTVEIAESMGAKVLHFTWINDFSAAKNYAIDQAKGDWIAFLDADEYYSDKDARELYHLIQRLSSQPEWSRKDLVIRSAWLQLEDNGNVFSTSVQDRVFKNSPYIRYKNRIHEVLNDGGTGRITYVDATKQLSIFHTGYSASSYSETGKAERNIQLLKEEVTQNPGNYNIWSYLGESLLAANCLDEAKEALQQAIQAPTGKITPPRLNAAYLNLMKIVINQNPEDGEQKLWDLKKGLAEAYKDTPDTDYWLGIWYRNHQKSEEAAECLERTLIQLDQMGGSQAVPISSNIRNIYEILMEIYYRTGKKQLCVKNCVYLLRLAPRVERPLKILLSLFRAEPGSSEDATPVAQFLEKFYDFSKLRDKLFVMKIAKGVGFSSLYELLLQSMSREEQKWLFSKPQNPRRLSYEQFHEKYPDTPCRNEADRDFLTLMEEIASMTKEALVEDQKQQIQKLSGKAPAIYQALISFFGRYPFWGRLDPEKNQWEALEWRTESLKEHQGDLLWLYGRLEDNRSRAVLTSILTNWRKPDQASLHGLEEVMEHSAIYFDPDLIPTSLDQTFVDVGAYMGETVQDYIKTFGENYKKIYCYEITPSIIQALESRVKYYDRIEVRPVAVGSADGTRYLSVNQEASENRVLPNGDLPVEVVTLDEDVKEPVNLIKVSVVGAEQEVLKGCKRHITEEHPKLAIGTYYGYEDLWKIPRMLDEMDRSYHFYLRYYGGNLVPTKYVLYAV